MSEKEWQTRKNRIDTRLKALPSPWKIIPYDPTIKIKDLHGVAIEEYPTDNGPADYVFVVGGKIIGILEAKKVTINPQNVLEQAKRYSKGLSENPGKWQDEFYVPFLYSFLTGVCPVVKKVHTPVRLFLLCAVQEPGICPYFQWRDYLVYRCEGEEKLFTEVVGFSYTGGAGRKVYSSE